MQDVLLFMMAPPAPSMKAPPLTYGQSPYQYSGFRRFDSGILLILRVGIIMSTRNIPEGLSQAILVGIILVGRLAAAYIYIYIYAYNDDNNNDNDNDNDVACMHIDVYNVLSYHIMICFCLSSPRRRRRLIITIILIMIILLIIIPIIVIVIVVIVVVVVVVVMLMMIIIIIIVHLSSPRRRRHSAGPMSRLYMRSLLG